MYTDDDGKERVLLYSMDHNNDNIVLEERFLTTVSLNVRLETKAAASAQPQLLYSKPQNIYKKQA